MTEVDVWLGADFTPSPRPGIGGQGRRPEHVPSGGQMGRQWYRQALQSMEQTADRGVDGEHRSGRHETAEQPRAAAAAAGSVRPGGSQEAGGGQARQQERHAATHS